ncbi:hypothetical protein [Sphingomonas sp. PR090111-T3T-6A]|uniref:hypothetical protein n=1 Tax=Sphingomonas sp. PR090111-T3T-6A TaxID=685778 RepID=UPI000360D70F|nr:hypothetical protein [Sphingomonas sp. PR090111-T3T-6A]
MTVTKKKAPRRWTQARQRTFLETLAQTSNVAASERKAKMPVGSAYRERRRSPGFEAAWREALAEGYARLEHTMLERALLGITRRVKKSDDGQETVEYSDRLGMALLAAHRASALAARPGVAGTAAEGENAREWLARKLAEMNRRIGGDAE